MPSVEQTGDAYTNSPSPSHDHTCLPDRIAWGEHLARYIYNWLNDYTYYTAPQNDCAKVQVIRTDEDIWAEYPA